MRCDDAEFSNKEKLRLKEKITELTNEIDNLKLTAENTHEISELKVKICSMEKEIAKLKRTVEVLNYGINFFKDTPMCYRNLILSMIWFLF